MNQAIQFPEREWWDEAHQAVCFHAVVNGFMRICAIQLDVLQRRYGLVKDPLGEFQRNRWDLEEEAESKIKAGETDTDGWIWLH